MHAPPRNPGSAAGFTLAEVLVAMVIFLTVMSGVMVMFSASVTGVRESYARKDAYETGRTTLHVISRDLESAFNAREHGSVYNFYGTPYGFMFVGTLPGGELGRVTYALRESGQVFEMDAMANVDIDAANASGAIGAGNEGVVAAVAERTVVRPRFVLIRYEERGVANLDDFRLPGNLQWPAVDPVFSGRDRSLSPRTETGTPDLLGELRRAVRNPDGTDLRDMVLALRYSGGAEGLHAVDKNFVETVIASRKRQLWIDMVAGRAPFLNQLTAAPGDNFNNDYFARLLAQQGYELADFAVAEDLLATVITDDLRNDLVINAAGVIATRPFFTYAGADGSRVTHFNTLENLEFPNLDDATRGHYFTDAVQAGFPRQFTTYTMLRSNMNQGTLRLFDDTLARVLSGRRGTATALGLPMLPRLPALVEPNFVAARPPERVGGVFYERHFTQAIQIPVGLSRGLPPKLAPSPS